MGTFLMRSVLLVVGIGIASAGVSPEICSIVRDSYGLVPPTLPTNFEFRGEFVDQNKNTLSYEEVYFDYTNSRAKLVSLHNGVEHHLLFDYEVHQVVEYYILHPGMDERKDILSHTCTATDMEESSDEFIFGLVDPDTDRPKMFTANQVLRFGGPYTFAYNETDSAFAEDRGLVVDKFIGCVFDPFLNATINSTYLFTNKKVLTSAGSYDVTVTGDEQGGILSVPVKADQFGAIINGDKVSLFNTTLNIFWFKANPEFRSETFRIPQYMYCKDYLGRYDMPPFPTAFSTRVQITSLESDIMGKLVGYETSEFEEIFYYKEKKLARRDYTPNENLDTEIFSKFGSYEPVRTVFDFNQGVVFVTNQPTERCYVRPILQGDFFESSENKVSFVMMGSPEDIFRMHTDDMEHKGHDIARDIECDVWVGRTYDELYNATFIKETYISAGGWHSEVEEISEFGIPIKHTIINEELNDELVEGVATYNFFKFKSAPPPLSKFSVDNCVDEIEHKDFAIKLEVDEETKKIIFKHKASFLETAHYYLSRAAQYLTPLRIQRLELSLINVGQASTMLLFTMMGKPNLHTKVPGAQKGPSLDEAVTNLRNYIDTLQFNIRFYITPQEDEMIIVAAQTGSLYVKKTGGDLSYVQEKPKMKFHEPVDVYEEKMKVVLNEESLDEGDGKGLTSGGLTALAFSMLFIGIGIGIAVMYLYIRKFSEKSMDDRIALSTASTSGTLESAQ